VKEVDRVGSRGIEPLHLCAQGLELLEGDVARAAFCGSGLAVLSRLKRLSALFVKLGDRDDVGRIVKIALRVSAHELAVLGKCDIALEDPGAHASSSKIGFEGVLGELESATTAVSN
jgi:hypothetical protein